MTLASTRSTTSRAVATSYPRLVIEHVQPTVDTGRYPVKRMVGDVVEVEATVYKEGHDLIRARIRYRGPGDRDARAAPMIYDRNLDQCQGSFPVDRIGRWSFTVEAWTDRFASWRSDLEKKATAGQDTHADLIEGARLIDEAFRRARGRPRAQLEEAAAILREPERPWEQRTKVALQPDLLAMMEQYLPAADLTRVAREFPVEVDREIAACAAWYEMFPRSQGTEPGQHATFADAEQRLPALADLGFDVIYLPPIHPIGHTHRKGPNNSLVCGPDDPGSPWAIGNEEGGHTAIEPKLGTLDDFRHFVGRAAELGMEVALDYALQCSPDHPWVREHPDWFFVRPDGTIKYAENPPKKYEDIYPLNFWCADYLALWQACRDIFLFWIDHGVKIFRVDNPHTKPFTFWEWVLGDLKSRHPDTVFLSEAFTRPARMKGLAKLGFTQSYTYFTWRNTSWELREYLTELAQTEMAEYFRPNFFVNTPDILHEYLQTGGRPAFRARLVLGATLSPLYGIYSGFELCENVPVRAGSEEYLNSEKYEIRVRDWNAPGNISGEIRRINEIRREHPALQRLTSLSFCHSDNDQVLCYHRGVPGDHLLIAVNLDPHHPQETQVHVPLEHLGIGEDELFDVDDLLTGARYTWRGTRNYIRLDPAEQVAHILHVKRHQ